VAYFRQPVPREPKPVEDVYREFKTYVLPYPKGNIHPRFWAYVEGTGTATGMLADMLASGMNPNTAGGNHIAGYVEQQVVDWCKEAMGFPVEASGLLLSGGSMANLTALAVARQAKAECNLRRDGMTAAPRPMVLYASEQVHSSNQKAVELLGLGSNALRKIPVNEAFEMDISSLLAALREDRKAGYQPFCVIGCAGTVNTGAFDDLDALADICRREGLWFHVDGAFGAWANLVPALRQRTSGMERADSLAFDLHKWMYVPFEAGCVLVRDRNVHREAFSIAPVYLKKAEGGLSAGPEWMSHYGIELSRGFRGLKVWMDLKIHGLQAYADLIEQNIEQARYLADLVDAESCLERLATVSSNIVCYRYCSDQLKEAQLNDLNAELLVRLQEKGTAVPSSTVLRGKYALRAAVTNHRSRRQDFEVLARETVRIGNALARSPS
jgi:glutamate/tyrosine decarboxylase-like PLP-dependent enzyme